MVTSRVQPKILAAMDGSDQALGLAVYLGSLLAGSRARLVLFHVLDRVPESFYDVSGLPGFKRRAAAIRAWDLQQEDMIRTHLDTARQTLLNAGVPAKAVQIKVRQRKKGVARDILAESARGYAALAVGRRGTGGLGELVMGSIAAKLADSLGGLPLWVVGGAPESDGFVVGVDGSQCSLRAVEHLAAVVRGKPAARVRLVFVLRRLNLFAPALAADQEIEESWGKDVQEALGPVLTRAENILLTAGLARSQVKSRAITGAPSRAGALVAEAARENLGTIVLGRRGLSKVEQFFMGRVTGKVLGLARDRAVWIVS